MIMTDTPHPTSGLEAEIIARTALLHEISLGGAESASAVLTIARQILEAASRLKASTELQH